MGGDHEPLEIPDDYPFDALVERLYVARRPLKGVGGIAFDHGRFGFRVRGCTKIHIFERHKPGVAYARAENVLQFKPSQEFPALKGISGRDIWQMARNSAPDYSLAEQNCLHLCENFVAAFKAEDAEGWEMPVSHGVLLNMFSQDNRRRAAVSMQANVGAGLDSLARHDNHPEDSSDPHQPHHDDDPECSGDQADPPGDVEMKPILSRDFGRGRPHHPHHGRHHQSRHHHHHNQVNKPSTGNGSSSGDKSSASHSPSAAAAAQDSDQSALADTMANAGDMGGEVGSGSEDSGGAAGENGGGGNNSSGGVGALAKSGCAAATAAAGGFVYLSLDCALSSRRPTATDLAVLLLSTGEAFSCSHLHSFAKTIATNILDSCARCGAIAGTTAFAAVLGGVFSMLRQLLTYLRDRKSFERDEAAKFIAVDSLRASACAFLYAVASKAIPMNVAVQLVGFGAEMIILIIDIWNKRCTGLEIAERLVTSIVSCGTGVGVAFGVNALLLMLAGSAAAGGCILTPAGIVIGGAIAAAVASYFAVTLTRKAWRWYKHRRSRKQRAKLLVKYRLNPNINHVQLTQAYRRFMQTPRLTMAARQAISADFVAMAVLKQDLPECEYPGRYRELAQIFSLESKEDKEQKKKEADGRQDKKKPKTKTENKKDKKQSVEVNNSKEPAHVIVDEIFCELVIADRVEQLNQLERDHSDCYLCWGTNDARHDELYALLQGSVADFCRPIRTVKHSVPTHKNGLPALVFVTKVRGLFCAVRLAYYENPSRHRIIKLNRGLLHDEEKAIQLANCYAVEMDYE